MSYSFTVRAGDKVKALEKVAAELTKVVSSQKMHAADQSQAQAAADAFINVLRDDPSKEIVVAVNGYIQTNKDGPEQVSITISASLDKKL